MQNTDMHHAYVKSLILVIGGNIRNTKALLSEVSKKSGVGYSSLRAAYYGRWISKNQFVSNETLRKLELAAENAEKTHDLVTFTELQISIWETSPELFGSRIQVAREFIRRLRCIELQSRDDEAGIAAAAAGFAAAAAKT